MARRWPWKLVRGVLAALVVANGLSTPVAFGHAHPLADHESPADHGHGHAHHEHVGPASSGHQGDHDDRSAWSGSAYHQHGLWWGVPYRVPASGARDASASPFGADMPAFATDVDRPGPGAGLGSADWSTPPGLGPPAVGASPVATLLLVARHRDPIPSPGTVRAHCVALRR